MILKPWTELPTPRHLLDENDDLDQQDAGFILAYDPFTTVNLNTELKSTHLVVVANRFSSYFAAASQAGEVVGKVVSGFNYTPPSDSQPDTGESGGPSGVPSGPSGLYEVEQESAAPEASKKVVSESAVIRIRGSSTVFVQAPALEPRQSYSFATALLQTIGAHGLSQLTVLTPASVVNSSATNVFGLYSGNVDPSLKKLPLLDPPASVSGPIASLIALAQRGSIPIAAIAVRGDGTVGHEAIDHESTEYEVQTQLRLLTGVEIRRQSTERESMYL